MTCACGCGTELKTAKAKYAPYHHWRCKTYPVLDGLLFDAEDADLSTKYWKVSHKGYVMKTASDGRGGISFHRVVLERMLGRALEPGELCDHINRNRLDNRRSNLRVTDLIGNAQNRSAVVGNTSGHRGVSWWTAGQKWRVQWTYKGRKYHIGVFDDVSDAVAAFERRWDFVRG